MDRNGYDRGVFNFDDPPITPVAQEKPNWLNYETTPWLQGWLPPPPVDPYAYESTEAWWEAHEAREAVIEREIYSRRIAWEQQQVTQVAQNNGLTFTQSNSYHIQRDPQIMEPQLKDFNFSIITFVLFIIMCIINPFLGIGILIASALLKGVVILNTPTKVDYTTTTKIHQ